MNQAWKFKDYLFGIDEKKSDDNDPKAKSAPNCPKKHGLTLFKTPVSGYGCDFCSKPMVQYSQMYGCRKCDYDLCIDCYKQVSVFMQQNDTSKGVEFKINKSNGGSVSFYPCANITWCQERLKTQPLLGSNYCSNEYKNIEATFDWDKEIANPQKRSNICSFIDCAELAYARHYPLVLKCEHIFILVLQAIAVHVDKNAEKLRNKYVSHEGQKTLTVYNQFTRGSRSNDWSGEISKFAAQIDKNTKSDTVPLFESNFSTSTLVEQIASKICLMSTCKHYFKYDMVTFSCGFPEITLEGNIDDWILLKQKVTKLLSDKVDKRFGKQWGAALLPILDRFIGAFKGDIDMVFWNSMVYKGQWKTVEATGVYGGGEEVVYKKFISGWINVLFPFLGDEYEVNRWCVPYDANLGMFQYKGGGLEKKGPEPNEFPKGTVSAPVKWIILTEGGKTYPLTFEAGYMGFEQNPKSLALTPVIGWYIKHKTKNVYG